MEMLKCFVKRSYGFVFCIISIFTMLKVWSDLQYTRNENVDALNTKDNNTNMITGRQNKLGRQIMYIMIEVVLQLVSVIC